MPLNFPLLPLVDTQYTFEDRTWVWNGRFWKAISTTIGYTGSQGAGFTGSIGFTGSRGPAGTSVTIVGSVASSSGLPDPYSGNLGDGYIARDTGNLWVWTGNTWSDVGQIQGYTGSLGYTGSIGYTGSAGADGFVGRDGYTGSIGFTGSQGIAGAFAGQGYSGSLGYTGSIGFTGSEGFVGSQGDTGYTGSQGDLGYTGSSGAFAALGYTGSQGIAGEYAAQGYAGSQGQQGSTGFTGSQGIAGEYAAQGYTGSQGIAGEYASIGFTGSQGYSGSQGYTGSQGVPGEYAALGYTGSTGGLGYTGSVGGFNSLQSFTTVSTASYTLLAGDGGSLVRFTYAGNITVTIPNDSTLNFSVGQRIDLQLASAGYLLIAAAGGVTLSAAGGALYLIDQYSVASVIKISANTWNLVGPTSSGFAGSVGYTGSQGAGFTGSTGYTGSIGGFQSVQVINDQTVSYTLLSTDIGKLVRFNSASTLTLTVPLNSVVPMTIGQRIDVASAGIGGVLISGSGGVTISAANSSLSLINQYSAGTLLKTGTDTWLFIGPVSSGYTGSVGFTGSVGYTGSAAVFSGLSDATSSSLTIDKFYLPAITRLTVTANGSTAYRFDQYGTTDDPTIYAINGTTIAFDLGTGALSSHPFLIQTSPGNIPYNTGLVHVTAAGVVSTGSAAQGQTSGTLYWKIPNVISGNYRYICANHPSMVGTITIKEFSAI